MSLRKRICPICDTLTFDEKCPADGCPTFEPPSRVLATGELHPGDTFDGKYHIEEIIGRGGTGRIYRAVQISVKRTVALKVLADRFSKDAKHVKRFHREALAASKLEHPNTIRIYDFGYARDKSLYIAMEFLKGIVLSDAIRETRMTIRRICKISIQILKSLAEAHSSGIVHRDLKSENIFLKEVYGEEDFVKVLDFGIARFVRSQVKISEITGKGTIFGTVAFMSPEQIRDEDIDQRTDIYSFGVVLYEMLAGMLPFMDNNPVKIMFKHLNEDVPEIKKSHADENIPEDLVKLMKWCLEKNRDKRPLSVEHMIPVIERIHAESVLKDSIKFEVPEENIKTIKIPHLPQETKEWDNEK
jgi:serine/threonine-protein kinase